MSLVSWKREFYRTPADKVSKKYALQHSLKKWVGLLFKNRTKHKVSFENNFLYDEKDNRLDIDSSSCALCQHYYDIDYNNDEVEHCYECPLQSCGDAYFSMIDYNRAMPMVNLIKKAMERKKK